MKKTLLLVAYVVLTLSTAPVFAAGSGTDDADEKTIADAIVTHIKAEKDPKWVETRMLKRALHVSCRFEKDYDDTVSGVVCSLSPGGTLKMDSNAGYKALSKIGNCRAKSVGAIGQDSPSTRTKEVYQCSGSFFCTRGADQDISCRNNSPNSGSGSSKSTGTGN